MVTAEHVMRARSTFKDQFPKFEIGVRTNGDDGYKLVTTVAKQSQADKLPKEIEGVPLEIIISPDIEKKKMR